MEGTRVDRVLRVGNERQHNVLDRPHGDHERRSCEQGMPRDHLELSPRVARIEAHEPIQLNVRVDTPPQPFEFGLGL